MLISGLVRVSVGRVCLNWRGNFGGVTVVAGQNRVYVTEVTDRVVDLVDADNFCTSLVNVCACNGRNRCHGGDGRVRRVSMARVC